MTRFVALWTHNMRVGIKHLCPGTGLVPPSHFFQTFFAGDNMFFHSRNQRERIATRLAIRSPQYTNAHHALYNNEHIMEASTMIIGRQTHVWSVKEAATKLQMSERTLKNRINDGLIRAYKPGGRWLITQEALDEYLASTEGGRSHASNK